jgi:hypothetical protein
MLAFAGHFKLKLFGKSLAWVAEQIGPWFPDAFRPARFKGCLSCFD